MKLTFNIDYRTNWGESLYFVGDIKELGENLEGKAQKMTFNSVETWSCVINIPDDAPDFNYKYFIKRDDGSIIMEWGEEHQFLMPSNVLTCDIFDRWQDQPYNKHYYSSAFTDGIFSRSKNKMPLRCLPGNVMLNIYAPTIKPDEYLAISGDNAEMDNWNIKKAIPMNDHNYPLWSVNIDIKKNELPFSYKFIILKKGSNKLVAWEDGDNRILSFKPAKKSDAIIIAGLKFLSNAPQWKGAGVAIPVFSLRSDDDFGVGDFYDLYKMIDWAVATGQNFLQILPINDTTMTHSWTDSYPYNANSTFALHPMFLRLNAIGTLTDAKEQAYYDNLAKELNALPEIDYERVNNAKNDFLHKIFNKIGAKTLNEVSFKKFLKANEYWLTPYAAFCVLRDINSTPDFSQWGKFSKYEEKEIIAFCDEHIDEIQFIFFVQYFLDKQMREVRNYAHKKGIVIKGDIPIGISRTSADAWVNPKLFNMDCQAGAPPDDFSVLGQNWGFPTYNWEEMSKDGFKWWKDRFKKMAEYFDAYRIDHILGFFRIWQIPMDAVHGLLGTFYPAMPFNADELRNNYDFWIDKDLHTTPYIMDYFLTDFFGSDTAEVKENFLVDKGYGRYGLKEFVNTQKKVVEYFTTQDNNERNTTLRDALLGLIDNVLFIEDANIKNTYHPRISAQFTYIYRSLSDYERWCFDRLYNDFFYHRHNDFWYGKAMWKLPPLINSTDMLVCGEDLGMIPDCVSAVMNSQQILSLEIQRMPKDPRAEFGNTNFYPYLSVCTTSTHDMAGIRAWWEEDRDKTQHFYNNVLHEIGTAPYFAEPWICDKIVTLHLNSPSMLSILPLQDWLSIHGTLRRENPLEEQINIPANSRHYWRYRIHHTLEKLLSETEFNKYLKDKIKSSGR
ncbi:MAG: 4-alpha-glucanotransferase [Muribaculaceae bacterium]